MRLTIPGKKASKGLLWMNSTNNCRFLLYVSGQSTDITVSTTITDKSLGRDVGLPVLMCHPRHANYTEVTWGKDNTVLKSMRTSDSRSHYLSLADLLNETSFPALELDNPLKLQGYYWCQTDQIATLILNIHGYFFRIKGNKIFLCIICFLCFDLGRGSTSVTMQYYASKPPLTDTTPSIRRTYLSLHKSSWRSNQKCCTCVSHTREEWSWTYRKVASYIGESKDFARNLANMWMQIYSQNLS